MAESARNDTQLTTVKTDSPQQIPYDENEPHYPNWVLKFAPKTSMLYRLFLGPDPLNIRRKIYIMTAIVVSFNVAVWVAAAIIFRTYPGLIGIAALAYTLGLRHAVDAGNKYDFLFWRYSVLK